jgi:hypothetical protein
MSSTVGTNKAQMQPCAFTAAASLCDRSVGYRVLPGAVFGGGSWWELWRQLLRQAPWLVVGV